MDKVMKGRPADVGRCESCQERVAYFTVVVSGYKCPKCGGPESKINWWEERAPEAYLQVWKDGPDPGAWKFNVNAAIEGLKR